MKRALTELAIMQAVGLGFAALIYLLNLLVH